MSRFAVDPLLGIARAVLYIIMAVIGVATIVVAITVPGTAIFNGPVTAQLTAHGAPAWAVWPLLSLLSVVAGILSMAFMFFRHLKNIVDTVGEGDPFVPVNADRLAAMAWLAVAINVLGLVAAALGGWIAKLVHDVHGSVKIGTDFGGIVRILTLFILARVFRKGAEMREELEGTV